MHHHYGIKGDSAPELRDVQWLANVEGDLRIEDLSEPIVYLFAFQSWCAGCHSHGFPTLNAVKEMLESEGSANEVKFVAVHTVFEGYDENTTDAAMASATRHGLGDIALGHTQGNPPALMVDYRTGGTPWTVIVGPRPHRRVLFNDFHADARKAMTAMQPLINRK